MILTRVFDLATVRSFADLSGDHNPVHVDPLAARRTMFGRPIVHGTMVLLWALDRLEAASGERLGRLRATFHCPVPVGEPATLELRVDGARFRAQVECEGRVAAKIRGELSNAPRQLAVTVPAGRPPAATPRARTGDEVVGAEGSVPLVLDREATHALFPRLLTWVAAHEVATLCASTRALGMDVPGLHSLHAGLDLTFDGPANGELVLGYRARSFDPRFARLEIALTAPGTFGQAAAFVRQPPRDQLSADDLGALVVPNEFAGRRALVIGGSRGIGEVAAKLLAVAGADVVLTYHRGRDDAERVVASIRAAGGSARAIALDVADPNLTELDPDWRPDLLGYFASPHIGQGDPQHFSTAKWRHFVAAFVDGFARMVEAALARGAERLDVFYPSTAFLDDPPPEQAEYVAAKAAAEALCALLPRRDARLRVRCPRIPKVLTDQTLSLLPDDSGDPAPLVLDELRELRDQP